MTPTQWMGAGFVACVALALVIVGCVLLACRRTYPTRPVRGRTLITFECSCPACERAAERIAIGDRLDDVERDERAKAGA